MTNIRERYGLTRVINARGTFTPLGVSRSSPAVCEAVGDGLGEFLVIDELQQAADHALSEWSGAEAGTVTHCAAAAVTLAAAAAMVGGDAAAVARLPDTAGVPNRIALPVGHAVNYGHPLVQGLRLAGAEPVLVGNDQECLLEKLELQLDHPEMACLMLVSSRLTRGLKVDLTAAVDAAHRRGVPAIIDGAAQDFKIKDLLRTGADLVLVSGQKYLASPTAGLVIGRRRLVDAVRAHEKGIGRGMKATKEAIIGVLAALEHRRCLDLDVWQAWQQKKVDAFIQQADSWPGTTARAEADPTGLPFSRVHLSVDPEGSGIAAAELAHELRAGTPAIWLMEHRMADQELVFELVAVEDQELGELLTRISDVLAA